MPTKKKTTKKQEVKKTLNVKSGYGSQIKVDGDIKDLGDYKVVTREGTDYIEFNNLKGLQLLKKMFTEDEA